jgi:hypothetical protein
MPPHIKDGCVIRVRRKEVQIELREGLKEYSLGMRRDPDKNTLIRMIEAATKRQLVRVWAQGKELDYETLGLEEKLVLNIQTQERPPRTGEMQVFMEANGQV